MSPTDARQAILREWHNYTADPQTTLSPGSFFRWLREEHPELLSFETEVSRFEQVKRWLAEG